MEPSDYVKYLEARATTCDFKGFALLSTENNVRFLSISFESPDSQQEKKKIFQNLQTPEYRFISLEILSFISVNHHLIPTPNRCQVRFKIL